MCIQDAKVLAFRSVESMCDGCGHGVQVADIQAMCKQDAEPIWRCVYNLERA